MLVADDGVADVLRGGSYAEIGRAFAFDNRIGRVAHFVINGTFDDFIQIFADLSGEAFNTGGSRDGAGPDQNLAVAVFADDVGMDGCGRDAEVASENAAEPGGIEHGTGAENAVLGEAGKL